MSEPTLIDYFEAHVERMPQVALPLTHRFTPGLYIREIFMPAGAFVASKIHRYEHPFVISQGVVSVYIPGEDAVMLRAPHTGITKPGTRRALYIHEDTVWITFHVNPDGLTDPDEIEERIAYTPSNPLLPDGYRNPLLSKGDGCRLAVKEIA